MRIPPALPWPLPPFFRLADSQLERSRECALQFTDGRVIGGELGEFEAGMDCIDLRLPGRPETTRIELAKVRSIKLTRPIAYVADTAVLDAIGATNARVDNE